MDGPSRQQPTWIARARNPLGHVFSVNMDSGLDAEPVIGPRVRADPFALPRNDEW